MPYLYRLYANAPKTVHLKLFSNYNKFLNTFMDVLNYEVVFKKILIFTALKKIIF